MNAEQSANSRDGDVGYVSTSFTPADWWLRAIGEERDRWLLWVPVGIGMGVLIYFHLPVEPGLWVTLALVLLAIIALVVIRRRFHAIFTGLLICAPLIAGFAAATIQAAIVGAPVLTEKIGPRQISGRVIDVEDVANGRRLVLSPILIPDMPIDQVPSKVRIRVPFGDSTPWPGDWITGLVVLNPPPPPVAPGAFDFQRYAYFKGLGAIGFSMGAVQIDEPSPSTGHGAMTILLSQLRQAVYHRIIAALPGREGAVAAALITGERGRIDNAVLSAMRSSGLAHLLAISGLHIGLIAGCIFFFVRGSLALVPAIALRYPIKKWAAIVALLGAFGYLLLAGATIPTQRAFLMIALVLLAVMTDRTGVSMRLVAWAATVVLLFEPQSILGASFQLSFAAVVALVATYETLRGRFSRSIDLSSWWQRPALYVGGVALTSLVAGLATGPFAVANFNRFALYGLAANMVAVPVTAFWVMPWGLASLCLMPFGLEQLALVPMGWGISVILSVAETVSVWPGAVRLLPTPPAWSILAIAMGGIWLCLWQRSWRLAGVPLIALGLFGFGFATTPDILITHDGRLIAVQDTNGQWLFSSKRRERFVRDAWLRRLATESWDGWPDDGPSAGGSLQCDLIGCIYQSKGWTISIILDEAAAEEDCQRVDAIVATVPIRRNCLQSPGPVIDWFDLWRDGAHAVWLAPSGIKVEAANPVRGKRPWVPVK